MEQIPLKISQRDILLVPFPFSDLSGKKLRPVLVVSKDDFNNHSDDMIVCAITSNLAKSYYSFDFENSDLEEGKLFDRSIIKIESIAKLKKRLVIKKIAKIKKEPFLEIMKKLKSLFN